MTTTNIQLPCLEDTGLDRNQLYIPKEWTERFRLDNERNKVSKISKFYQKKGMARTRNLTRWN